MAPGYSGTPLAKKLGFRPGQRVWLADMPDSVRAEIVPAAIGLTLLAEPEAGMDAAHVFVTTRADLERHIAGLRELLAPDGMLWVSWPKKASKVPTDITEDTIRAVALPIGLVDVKVCAVDDVWSGLKLVIRKALRTA
jgi:hypothetical protein